MVHADAASIPDHVTTKAQFYEHLQESVGALLGGQRNWVSNLSNASSVIYASLNRFPAWAGSADKSQPQKPVNWAGFYLLSPLFPGPTIPVKRPTLLLGPFCGLPACQQIQSVPGRGVCADASSILPPRALRVDDTEAYPGHIACDSASKSEIVIPLVVPRSRLSAQHQEALKRSSATTNGSNADASGSDAVAWAGRGDGDDVIIGVLDIDCEALEGFDEEDERGLTRLTQIIADACDW
ncbi:hypothetical protein OC846_000149 [Tilletia horrida]|uniref:GAF domain-containing protein n=1 Tax=Tilletia horrida TaxID=155126 RepID=A0AAN6JU41_9BASI|nr:hypothetical protein OC846_000149 [Tilletia horrida]